MMELKCNFLPMARALASVLALSLGVVPAVAQDVNLSVVGEPGPGMPIMVDWMGPNQPGDFLAMSRPESAVTEFIAYHRISAGSPAEFPATDIGEFEIRYIAAADLTILARVTISIEINVEELPAKDEAEKFSDLGVTETTSEESAATETRISIELFSLVAVDVASEFSVAWTGSVSPGARMDIADMTSGTVVSSKPIGDAAPISMTAPQTRGWFEIRLVASNGSILGHRELEVR